MDNVIDVLSEILPNMRITTIVQTGFINVEMTDLFAKHGKVHFYTPATFNPFEGNKNVKHISDVNPNVAAKTFKTVDVLALNGAKDYNELRMSLSSWLVNVRKNGLILVTGTDNEKLTVAIKDIIEMVGTEAFEIQEFDTFTLINPTI